MSAEQLRQRLNAYRETPESFAHEMRLRLSQVVVRKLRELDWTQRELADKSGMKEPFVTRVLSGDQNWTTETAGRLLHALGAREHIQYVVDVRNTGELPVWHLLWTDGQETQVNLKDYASGKKAEIRFQANTTPIRGVAVSSAAY